MTVYISRDYNPTTLGYATNKAYTPCIYELAVFLHRVMGYSVVGQTGFDITNTVKTATVVGATNTTPIEITTSAAHGLTERQSVIVSGVSGNTAANGTWIINITGANTFTLVGSGGNANYTSGGTVSSGFFYTSGAVIDGYGAGINFGAGFIYEVSIPTSIRTVVSGDIGKMLILKSTKYPAKNSGCFKITGINADANRYIIDYRSTESPPVEAANSIDWWLYEIENTVSNYINNFTGNGAINIIGATNTSPIQLTLSGQVSIPYGFVTGQKIVVSGVSGNTAANGTWTITHVSSGGNYVYSLDGSVGNGTYTSGGSARIAGYVGDGYSFNNRIILQSPHSTGWQVRLCVEPTTSNLPTFSVTTGFDGNSAGDFAIGGANTHIPQYFDYEVYSANSAYANHTSGGGYISSTITNRMTIAAESSGQWVFAYARSTSSQANGILHFGIPDNEPVPTPADGYNRIFCYGASNNADFGGIILKLSSTNNIGFSCRNKYPQICTLSSWANLDGTSATSPLLSANAGDTPFTNSTELLPIEIWSGITADLALTGSITPPFSFDQYLMGTSPILGNGRTNFGNFTLTTEETTSRTITAATNASPIQITTSAANALVTGQTVTISGVTGNTAANGTWIITVIDSTNFTLNGSVGNGVYVSGGTVNGCPRWIHLQNGVYLKWDGPGGLSDGMSETSYSVLSDLGLNSTNAGTFNSTEKVTTTFNTYYKMRGYNPITQEYEYWHCMGEPLLTSPQGDSLINITILDVWQDR